MGKIIDMNKSIIPACDVPLEKFKEIVVKTAEIDKVGAYKVGFSLGLSEGLHDIVQIVKRYTKKPVIYDHQKAGTDIPAMGVKFADVLYKSEVDAAILFPQSGPETEKAWIKALQDRNIEVIVGGIMTHPKYLFSEGGYIADDVIIHMYVEAAQLGVDNFVVPGNKPAYIERIKRSLEETLSSFVFYAPGFVKQGGVVSDTTKVAGDNWHAIIGRGIYEADNITEAAIELTSQI